MLLCLLLPAVVFSKALVDTDGDGKISFAEIRKQIRETEHSLRVGDYAGHESEAKEMIKTLRKRVLEIQKTM